jgi:hypothetical protein
MCEAQVSGDSKLAAPVKRASPGITLMDASDFDLRLAAITLALSDLEELGRVEPGRNPTEVLFAAPPGTKVIRKGLTVLAVGGISGGCVWFVHTEHAEALEPADKKRMYYVLKDYLMSYLQDWYDTTGTHCTLSNKVSLDNTQHIRLLTSLGATFASPADFVYLNGNAFVPFHFTSAPGV